MREDGLTLLETLLTLALITLVLANILLVFQTLPRGWDQVQSLNLKAQRGVNLSHLIRRDLENLLLAPGLDPRWEGGVLTFAQTSPKGVCIIRYAYDAASKTLIRQERWDLAPEFEPPLIISGVELFQVHFLGPAVRIEFDLGSGPLLVIVPIHPGGVVGL